MKKLLGLLLAAVIAFPASAAVVKNVELKGEVQTIASDVRHNVLDATGNKVFNAGANMRAMAGLSFDVVEDVSANLLFQYAYRWGDNNEDGTGFANGKDVKLVNANVVLHNLFCCLEATVGRQFYGDEDSAVMYFGPNHYNAEGLGYAKALDAAKVAYADDVKAFTVIAGRIATMDDDINDPVTGDTFAEATLMGADFRLHLMEDLTAQVYGYNVNDITMKNAGVTYEANGNAGIYGAKVAFAPEAFRVSAEYARNFGGHKFLKEEGKENRGYMLKVDGAVNVEAFKVRGAFLYETEDFWAFGNYTPGLLIGHVFGGQTNLYSAEGVRMFNVGIDVNPFEKWTFSLDGYSFQDRFGHHSATFEGDLVAKYQHNEYVQLFAGFGYAKYGTNEPMNAPAGVTYKGYLHKDNFKGQLGMLINF